MLIRPINIAFAKATFPHIFAGYGERALERQVAAFNRTVTQATSTLSPPFVDYLMRSAGIKKPGPHMSLLNLMSALHDPEARQKPYYRFLAQIFHLEKNLRRLDRLGIEPTSFASLLRNPARLMDVVTETDVLASLGRLRPLGTLALHADTKPGTECKKNYDVDWSGLGHRLRGDVKCFDTWVMKKEGTDPLNSLLALLPDLCGTIWVTMDKKAWSDVMLVDAAVEVVALYDAATGAKPDPTIDVYRENGELEAFRLRKSTAKTLVAGVHRIRIDAASLADSGPPTIVTLETGSSKSDKDIDTVRARLLDAAKQVPASEHATDVAAAFLGSMNYQDAQDVSGALFGTPELDPMTNRVETIPGFFSPDTEELDLKHIQAVFFSSTQYHAFAVPPIVTVKRTCETFFRPGSLTVRQRILVWGVRQLLQRTSCVRVVLPAST